MSKNQKVVRKSQNKSQCRLCREVVKESDLPINLVTLADLNFSLLKIKNKNK